MRRILAGVAFFLASFLANQAANVLDLSYGLYAGAFAAVIGYGLVVTSDPARKYLWRQHQRGRQIMVILLTGIVTGLLGSATAAFLIRQEERLASRPKAADMGSQPTFAAKVSTPQGATMLPHPFIRPQIVSMVHEIELLSNKRFRSACLLLADEELSDEKRISFANLVHGKITVVKPLDEMLTAFHGVEQVMLYNRRVEPGYERVAEKYWALVQQRWIIAADRYKRGLDQNPSQDFRTCAYGLVEADRAQLNDLIATLDIAEAAIRSTPVPDTAPPFRIDYLHADLTRAGVPINGLSSPQRQPTPESDSGPTQYFELSDGSYLRATMEAGVVLSLDQIEKARQIIRAHEHTMQKQEKILEALQSRLARDGLRISSVRFTRSESELRFNPERFVAVDTELGILEIRGHEPFTSEQRASIRNIAVETLARRNH